MPFLAFVGLILEVDALAQVDIHHEYHPICGIRGIRGPIPATRILLRLFKDVSAIHPWPQHSARVGAREVHTEAVVLDIQTRLDLGTVVNS